MIMVWLFLLGIITLAVYSTGFRKVLLWGLPAWLFIAFMVAA
jgi:hypothetical protein